MNDVVIDTGEFQVWAVNWIDVTRVGDMTRRLCTEQTDNVTVSTSFMKDEPYSVGVEYGRIVMYEPHNQLAAMCSYRNTHSTDRLPVSTAKEAPAGILACAGFDGRLGQWR